MSQWYFDVSAFEMHAYLSPGEHNVKSVNILQKIASLIS